jgi:uncharacterized membrane-anchored protein
VPGPPPRAHAACYVVLEKTQGGVWQAAKIATELAREPSPDRIVLKGRTTYARPRGGSTATAVQVRYGIESYFVPEGQGRKLLRSRERKLATLLAVDARGNAAIKRIVVDGVLQYEEPLF